MPEDCRGPARVTVCFAALRGALAGSRGPPPRTAILVTLPSLGLLQDARSSLSLLLQTDAAWPTAGAVCHVHLLWEAPLTLLVPGSALFALGLPLAGGARSGRFGLSPLMMAVLFPRWFDHVFRLLMVAVVLGILGVPVLLMAWVRSPLHTDQGEPVVQPVQFDHRHHVRDDAIDCLFCHYDAARSPSAGLPDTATCMGCHAQIYTDSPQLEPVRRSYYDNEPIAWKRVHDLPDFVYFNHAAHVAQGVGCESCHGRVDMMAAVRKVESLQMGWCLKCHRDPTPHLRPSSQVTVMGYEPNERLGQQLAEKLAIDPPTHCSGCHR